MRFIEEGPDIPDKLLDSVAEGRAVFLCGAGVSKTAGLPLFQGLVEQVYHILGEPFETAPDEPEERRAFEAGEYDRVLRALEKRIRSPGSVSSRVREAVARILRPTVLPLDNHVALLRLSRDIEGRPRLVTTNFDTLFERAWSARLPSHAGPAMPAPGTPRDHGVLHLHGRIADEDRNLAETDLILTSADFGDAYLRLGWASRYVDERRRLHDLVLVGYQAEDAAMRLLLDAVDADRARFPDIKDVYAFESDEKRADQWNVKGVLPIVYGFDHDKLYRTIAMWADYAEQPREVTRKQLTRTLCNEAQNTSDFDKQQVAFLAKRHGPDMLAELNPPISWAKIFQEAGIFSASTELPRVDAWLAQRLNVPDTIASCIDGTLKLDENLASRIEVLITDRSLELLEPFRKAWQVIVRVAKSQPDALEWPFLRSLLKSDHRGRDVQRAIARTLRPRMRLPNPRRLDFKRDLGAERPIEQLADLVEVQMETNTWPTAEKVLSIWPEDTSAGEDFSLLRLLTHELNEALHDAADAERISDQDDLTDWDVKSVSKHEQDKHSHGFYPFVRVIADIWERLARKDASLARRMANDWLTGDFRLLRRLALHAFNDSIFPGEEVAQVILKISDAELSMSGLRREATKLLAERWNQLPDEARNDIENRLCKGPDHRVAGDDLPECDKAEWSERKRFVMLMRVVSEGGSLGKSGASEIERIRSQHPQWSVEVSERNDFDFWMNEVRELTNEVDISEFSGISEEELVEKALTLERENPFEHSHIWSSLCQAQPDRAFKGLLAQAKQEQWNTRAWRDWLLRVRPVASHLLCETAHSLLRMPREAFASIVSPIAGWLDECRQNLAVHSDLYWQLWDRAAYPLADQPDNERDTEVRNDIVFAALNRAPGHLAKILVYSLNDRRPQAAAGFPHDLAARFDMLVEGQGCFGLLARALCCCHLSYLFFVNPKFVKDHLFPRLSWQHDEAASMWEARSADKFGSIELFHALETPFLQLLLRDDVDHDVKRNMTNWLIIAAIHSQRFEESALIEPWKVRRVLRNADALVRSTAAWRLWREPDNGDYATRGENWRNVIGPVFRAIWPQDIDLHDGQSSKYLVQLALAAGDAVDAATDIISPFIVKHQQIIESVYFLDDDTDRHLMTEHMGAVTKLLLISVGDKIPPNYTGLLREILGRLASFNPGVSTDRRYLRLLSLVSR